MILEALVTTANPDGSAHVAPMGPEVGPDLSRFVLRPFRTATTYRNLVAHREGVLHVTDDVLMLARAAVGLDPRAETRPAGSVRGHVIASACRYYEFRVVEIDDRADRATIRAETVGSGVLREFFGLNRAKHAVVEAAILATRTEFLPMPAIADDFRRLRPLVEKTGGPSERLAFAELTAFVREKAQLRGEIGPDEFSP